MSVSRTALTVVLVSVFWVYIPQLLSPKLQPVWGGFTHKDFKHVETIFRQAIEDGRVKGGAIAAYYKGEVIVDLWGGYADVETERPWHEDTMTVFYSTTKLLGAIIVAQMVEKGLLDYNKPVSEYWPEFGQNGKDKITVEMLLSHQSGLALLDEGIYILDFGRNPKAVEDYVAKQKPRYEPGSRFGYHGLTFGLYVDTLVKKVDPKHRNVTQIFREDIAVPFDIDFYIGLPKQHNHRMAREYPLTVPQIIWRLLTSGHLIDLWRLYVTLPISGSDWSQVLTTIKDMGENQYFVNDPDKAAVGLTSYSGQGTARALAKLCSILANGGSYQGKQLLSPRLISKLATPLVDGTDDAVREHARFGPGTFLTYNPKGQTIFGHPGFGAKLAFADPHTGLSFSYCTNHHGVYHFWTDPLLLEMQSAIYEGLQIKER